MQTHTLPAAGPGPGPHTIDHVEYLKKAPPLLGPDMDQDSDQPVSYAKKITSLQKGSRAATFDTGALPKDAQRSRYVRARFQGIVKSLPLQKTNSYKHQPIEYNHEIRILKILHGEPNDKLACILFPSALGPSTSKHEKTKYWALSYWWGPEEEVANNKITIFHE